MAVSILASGGCGSSSSGDDSAVKPGSGVALNPGGKPQTAEEIAYAAKQQQTGAAMNADRDKVQAAMEAAKARTGGK